VFVIFKNMRLDFAAKNARKMMELLEQPASKATTV
jgi:hypothetical protein